MKIWKNSKIVCNKMEGIKVTEESTLIEKNNHEEKENGEKWKNENIENCNWEEGKFIPIQT